MGSIPQVKPESPWAIGGLIALCFIVVIPLVASPILVRTFLFQPFNIPARSMMPTFLVGDYFFVSKSAYGYSRYSWPSFWPFSPQPFPGRVWGSEPVRGDVILFYSTKDNSTIHIDRVVGLPGDRIQMINGLLRINDVPVARERLADFAGDEPCGEGAWASATKRWRETLPNGVRYETLDCVDNGFYDNTTVYTVPAGDYFVLGDNRDNSTDSRVLSAIGYVPLANIIGRAGMIFFSVGRDIPGGASGVRTERIGLVIR